MPRRLTLEDSTTAYGAKVEVPGDLDILIAGSSCVDFSNRNNKKKNQNMDEIGESADTFFAIRDYALTRRPTIVLLENLYKAPWIKFQEFFDEIDYESDFVTLDTKNYYLPHTRQRGYMVCVDRKQCGTGASDVVEKWVTLMRHFERPASSSITSFLLPDDDPRVSAHRAEIARMSREDVAAKQISWVLCQGRHQTYRTKFNLGFRRPFTGWVNNGTCETPDYTDKVWWKKQPERLWDFMEISLLRAATERHGGYDIQYKP